MDAGDYCSFILPEATATSSCAPILIRCSFRLADGVVVVQHESTGGLPRPIGLMMAVASGAPHVGTIAKPWSASRAVTVLRAVSFAGLLYGNNFTPPQYMEHQKLGVGSPPCRRTIGRWGGSLSSRAFGVGCAGPSGERERFVLGVQSRRGSMSVWCWCAELSGEHECFMLGVQGRRGTILSRTSSLTSPASSRHPLSGFSSTASTCVPIRGSIQG